MTKLIKLIILLIFFSVNTGYSSTEEIEAVDENDPNVLKFLNKRNITPYAYYSFYFINAEAMIITSQMPHFGFFA